VRTVTVSLSVASINDESRLPTSVLFAVPTDGYNIEVSTHAMPNGLGFRSRQKQVTTPKCSDRPWGPPSGYRGGAPCAGTKRSGSEVDYSRLFSAQVNEWSCIFTPLYALTTYRGRTFALPCRYGRVGVRGRGLL